jgi:CDP-glucose 4,6-dehydratase
VTTDKVYENKEWVWAYREVDRLGGYDPYSNSKACSEMVSESYRNSFFNVEDYGKKHQVGLATARSGNVIGGGDWSDDRLLPDFFRAHKKNETLVIRNPQAIRPWQHVLEALRGYINLAERLYLEGPTFSQAWNFGPLEKNYLTVEEVIKYLSEDSKVKVKFEPSSEFHETQILKLDWTKSKELLKWSPVLSIENTLDDIKSFYLDSMAGSNDLLNLILQSVNNYEKNCT